VYAPLGRPATKAYEPYEATSQAAEITEGCKSDKIIEQFVLCEPPVAAGSPFDDLTSSFDRFVYSF
jgi:hypothetical protein